MKPLVLSRALYRDPSISGIQNPGFLNQVPTLCNLGAANFLVLCG